MISLLHVPAVFYQSKSSWYPWVGHRSVVESGLEINGCALLGIKPPPSQSKAHRVSKLAMSLNLTTEIRLQYPVEDFTSFSSRFVNTSNSLIVEKNGE
jgi:hypothetical protein